MSMFPSGLSLSHFSLLLESSFNAVALTGRYFSLTKTDTIPYHLGGIRPIIRKSIGKWVLYIPIFLYI
jgi:hypothetical protein